MVAQADDHARGAGSGEQSDLVRMLAEITSQMLAMAGEHSSKWLSERSGIYHLAGWGYASRFEWPLR